MNRFFGNLFTLLLWGRQKTCALEEARDKTDKLLLSTSELSIKEIAEQLRFCAPSHFARVFREVTGQLPQAYRKENYK